VILGLWELSNEMYNRFHFKKCIVSALNKLFMQIDAFETR